MPINFPDSPAENDSFTSGGKKWIFNGTVWTLVTANSYTIPTGEVTAAKIASNAVTEAKINDGAVTQAKLASGLSGITVTTTANRSAVIPSPFTGQFIFLTDTSQLQRWDGSAWVSAIISTPTDAPSSVAVSGSPTVSAVTLTFTPGADGGSTIINYRYALSTNGGSTYGSYTALSSADATSPITITGLSQNTSYHVKLKAENNIGVSLVESSAVSFTTDFVGSVTTPASSGVEIYDTGNRTSGLYYITTNLGVKQTYVDLVTTDAVTNKGGWMLVGSWDQASRWSIAATTSTSVFDGTTVRNCLSANYGTMSTNFMRMHVSTTIANTGTNATSCDFYHYTSTARNWRNWWVTNSSNDIVWSTDGVGIAAANCASYTPRESFASFTHSYNLKYAYQVSQKWNGCSDGTGAPRAGSTGNFWQGLEGVPSSVSWNANNDGTFSILPANKDALSPGSCINYSGQDSTGAQTKFGSDDSSSVGATPNMAFFGSSANDISTNQAQLQGSDTKFWLWIK
jgi:hypothetical protein